jgi:hypothetical protein
LRAEGVLRDPVPRRSRMRKCSLMSVTLVKSELRAQPSFASQAGAKSVK